MMVPSDATGQPVPSRRTSAFKGVIFDFGNTLCASASLGACLPAAWPDPRAKLVGEAIESRIAALYQPHQREQPNWTSVWRAAFEEHGCVFSEDVAREHLRRFLHLSETYPYTKHLLTTLRHQGLRLALLSNATGPPEIFDEALRSKNLLDRFDAVVWSCAIGYRKPSREAFLFTLDRLGLPPEQVLMVGDVELADVTGAREVGLATARVVDDRAVATRADYTVQRSQMQTQLMRIVTGAAASSRTE